MDFEQVFRYRFSKNWALRNILVNYFVYWRGGERDPGVDVKKLHEFIKANGVFKGEQYPGIGRMLMIEDIFEEKTSIMDGTDYQYPGLIPEEHIQLFEKVVNDEYGLDQVLIKKPASYTVAKFMWNVYHNQNQFGRPGRKISSDHMLEIASQLFLDRFPRGLKVSEESSIRGKYLLVETDHYKWPLFFISGSRLINDEVEVFRVARAYKVSDPDSEFPTICGTYFGDKIKEFARESGIQLLQISSLFKFFRWVDSKKREGVDPEKIAPHLDLIPDQPEVPIPVGLAIQKIQKQI